MIKRALYIACGAMVLNLCGCATGGDDAGPSTGPRTDIRFYTTNRQNQEDRLKLMRKTGERGCHNLSRFREAHRVAVFGFESCTVYAKPDCASESAIVAQWSGRTYSKKNREARTSTLAVGTRWIIGAVVDGQKTTVPIRSWQCR